MVGFRGLRGVGLVLVLGVRLFDRSADLGGDWRIFGLANRSLAGMRLVGMRLVLVRDFGHRLIRKVSRMRLVHDMLTGRHVGRLARCFPGGQRIALHRFVAAGVRTLAVSIAAAARAAVAAMMIVGFFVVACGACVGLDQRLPVGDRDLVIVRVDFGERQESVAIAAVFDERRLQ